MWQRRRQGRPAQIGLEKNDAHVARGGGGGEVPRDSALAVAGRGRGDKHRLDVIVDREVAQVRAQRAECVRVDAPERQRPGGRAYEACASLGWCRGSGGGGSPLRRCRVLAACRCDLVARRAPRRRAVRAAKATKVLRTAGARTPSWCLGGLHEFGVACLQRSQNLKLLDPPFSGAPVLPRPPLRAQGIELPAHKVHSVGDLRAVGGPTKLDVLPGNSVCEGRGKGGFGIRRSHRDHVGTPLSCHLDLVAYRGLG